MGRSWRSWSCMRSSHAHLSPRCAGDAPWPCRRRPREGTVAFLNGFVRFWYDFIVGDDWTIAAAVVVALIATNLLVRAHVTSWWLLPLAVIVFLGASLWRVAR